VSGTVTVGPRESLRVDAIEATSARWCTAVPSSGGRGADAGLRCGVQLRAHGEEYPAVATIIDDRVEIELLEPASGVAPGQAAVLYAGTQVLGSATIASTRSLVPS
jgi:tRNA-uridine 2-sulfurtransferase